MKTFNITVTSKNSKSIKKFLRFLNWATSKRYKCKTKRKKFNKKEKKKFITILKSPHVNKKAQEQFEIRNTSAQLKIETARPFKFLIILKKIEINLFPDIKIKLKLVINKLKSSLFKKKFFNVDNFKIGQQENSQNIKFKLNKITFYPSKNFLHLFDIYGS